MGGEYCRQEVTLSPGDYEDYDMDTYRYDPMDKLLARQDKHNKDKYGNHCHKQWKKKSLFVLSVDIMLKKEALVVSTTSSRLMVEILKETL